MKTHEELTSERIQALQEHNQQLQERIIELEDRLRQYLPSECVHGYDEVKFCPTRQGDGGKCKECA